MTAEQLISGALFDFVGMLTSQDESVTLSGKHHAIPGLDQLEKFAKKRGLSLDDPNIAGWSSALSHPVVQPRLTVLDAPTHYDINQAYAWAAGVIAAVPPGYVLVPIDPTQEMQQAAKGSGIFDPRVFGACWALAVAAAPTQKEPT